MIHGDAVLDGISRHGTVPRNAPGERPTDPRALAAIDVVRRANKKPSVYEVSVFDTPAELTARVEPEARYCEMCKESRLNIKQTKFCSPCAKEKQKEWGRAGTIRHRERRREARNAAIVAALTGEAT